MSGVIAVLEDFERVLDRVQSDYDFYIECQRDPETALAGYDLTPEERATLQDPEELQKRLIQGVRITISGTHDWVNRAAPDKRTDEADHGARVEEAVEAVRTARSDDERSAAALRLVELVD